VYTYLNNNIQFVYNVVFFYGCGKGTLSRVDIDIIVGYNFIVDASIG